jgi:hypothetical protein
LLFHPIPPIGRRAGCLYVAGGRWQQFFPPSRRRCGAEKGIF